MTSLHNPGESLESIIAERDAALAELASMRHARSEVQEIATSRRAEIELLKTKISEHEAAAAADWKTFNDTKADREEWRTGYHAMTAERDAARREVQELRAALGARELNALQWLKQLMESDQRSTEHSSVLIAMANRLLGNNVLPHLRMPTGLTEAGQRAHAIIVAYLQRNNLSGSNDSRVFYSPGEWRARNEKYGAQGQLIIVYDGAELRPVFSMDAACDQGTYALYEGLQEELHKAGLYFEECTHWYSAVYIIQ